LSFTKVPAQRRYMHVAEQILRMASSGQIQPGEKLPSDRELAEAMGVSRPTVREALLALQLLGVVEVRAGDGAYVVHGGSPARFGRDIALPADFSVEPSEVIEARIAIEPTIARLSASRITPQGVESLDRLLEQSEAIARDPDQMDEFIRLGLGFHSALAPCSANRFLARACASLVDVAEHPLWALVNRRAMQDLDSRLGQVREHREVLDAIRRRDGEAAHAAMTEHLRRLRAAIWDPRDQEGADVRA
jgi:DNA-binding FadR family transcriptional regulator